MEVMMKRAEMKRRRAETFRPRAGYKVSVRRRGKEADDAFWISIFSPASRLYYNCDCPYVFPLIRSFFRPSVHNHSMRNALTKESRINEVKAGKD